MKERPILFSAPMVRAILDGRKSQTRRVVKSPVAAPVVRVRPGWVVTVASSRPGITVSSDFDVRCPYGVPGDRLWVRESVALDYFDHSPWLPPEKRHGYRADWTDRAADTVPRPKWTPSIHMPRWASRITLEVTGVRVERLQDISEEDSRAEGVEVLADGVVIPGSVPPKRIELTHRHYFRDLWKSINGAESWDANPWVWVVEFRRVEAAAEAA